MKAFAMVVCAMVAMVPSMSLAGSQIDLLRCEALKLTRESRYNMCLAHCDRRAGRSESFDSTGCEESCQTSLQRALDRIGTKRVCSDPPPDPYQCEAKVLKIEAVGLVCQSRCTKKGERNDSFDVSGCLAGCEETSATAHDEMMNSSICAAGAISGDS